MPDNCLRADRGQVLGESRCCAPKRQRVEPAARSLLRRRRSHLGKVPTGWTTTRATTHMQIPLILDHSRRPVADVQLVEQLRDAIRPAGSRAGTKLPSSRRLPSSSACPATPWCAPTRNCRSEGYVEARPASCVAVACGLPDSMPCIRRRNATARADDRQCDAVNADCRRCAALPGSRQSQPRRLSFDFFPGRPNAGLFPIKTWRRLMQNCPVAWRRGRAVAIWRSGRLDRAAHRDRQPSRR